MTRAKPFWLARIAVLALAVSMFAACEDDTGPTLSDYGDQESSVISQFLVQNEGLQGLKIFGSDISDLMASIAPVGPALSPGSRTITGLTRGIRASLAELGDAGPMAIPPEYLGTTFVYDPVEGHYVAKRSRASTSAVSRSRARTSRRWPRSSPAWNRHS